MIDILAQNIRGKIKEEVNESKMFSVMAETTPDTSNKDRLGVAVRYVKEDGPSFAVKERLLEVKETTDKTGNGQASDILTSLEDNGLKLSELIFQSYDFASNMSSVHNEAQAEIEKKSDRKVPKNSFARLIDAILSLSTHAKVAISSRNCSTSYRSCMLFSQEAQSVMLS